jgi:nitrogen fixation protein FixH
MNKKKFSWGTGIIIFISVFLLLDLIFILFSFSHKVDLVTNNYYEKELKYQDEINKQTNSSQLKERVTIDYQKSFVRIIYPKSLLSNNPAGTVRFYRPSNSVYDFETQLKLDSSGTQIIKTSGLIPGAWKIILNWNSSGVEYQDIKEVYIE